MTRRSLLTGSTILIAWLITMGFLFRDYYLQRSNQPTYTTESLFGSVKAIPRWQDVEEYMLIISKGSQGTSRTPVGATATIIQQVDNPTTAVMYRAKFNLAGKLAPLLPTATVKVTADLDKDISLTSFHGETSLGPLNISSSGLIADSTLYISTSNGNTISRSKVPFRRSISMAEALRPVLGRQMSIASGAKMSTPILDPLTGVSRGTLTIEVQDKEPITVNGTEIMAFRVISSIGDIETLMWVDDAGNTLRRQLVGNLFMERTTKDEALKQAPTLADQVTPQTLDIAEFADVPVHGSGDAQKIQPSGLGLIQGLLR